MEQNPFEQKNTEMENIKRELRKNLEYIFDNSSNEELKNRIDKFKLEFEFFKKAGLVFDEDKVKQELEDVLKTKDKREFVSHFLAVMEPFMLFKISRPESFEKAKRESEINMDGNFKLSEVLYLGFNKDEAQIHLATSKEFIKDKGLTNFKNEVEDGLKRLAEIINSNDKIKIITATSWIVAKNPGLLKALGFSITDTISEEDKKIFENEDRPIAKAFMTREDFLNKYKIFKF